jgi:hypothetical protein
MCGNCSVPLRYRSNPSLGRWVNRQREAKSKQLLSSEREVILDDIGTITVLDDSCYDVLHL